MSMENLLGAIFKKLFSLRIYQDIHCSMIEIDIF